MKICDVKDCKKQARSKGSALCKMHYHRMYRNGTLDTILTRQAKLKHSGGYIICYAKGHPLVNRLKTSYEYEHRIVYYDKYGEGPFNCNWCNKEITWDDLHIDHLDEVKTHNIITNLVASCPVCNQARGRHRQHAKMRLAGKILEFNGRSMCLSEWAREVGISHTALGWRLEQGWSLDKALTTERGKTGPR